MPIQFAARHYPKQWELRNGMPSTDSGMVKPILKWAGGKSQILHEILPRLPTEFNRYHEPFFGGGAVFFSVQPSAGTVNDLNSRLMNFYRQVQKNETKLIELNKEHQEELDSLLDELGTDGFYIDKNGDRDQEKLKEYYYSKREQFNSLRKHGLCENELLEASLLLLLNRLCYNGLYRENSSGEFNVPIGDFTKPDIVREERILKASEVLDGVEIFNRDYSYVENKANSGDAVYMDPPYKPVSDTADFSEYLAGGFSDDDQQELADLANRLHKKDIYVTISNSPPAAKYYDSEAFTVETIRANRVISSDASNRTGAREIIITNIPLHKRQGTISSFVQE